MPKKEAKMRNQVTTATGRNQRTTEGWRHGGGDSAAAVTAATETDTAPGISYGEMTKAELQDELSSRELPTTGNKADLVARLEENDTE